MLGFLATFMWVMSSVAQAQSFRPPDHTTQLIIAMGTTTETSAVVVERYTRADAASPWTAVGESFPARIGKNGMAWGLGLHGTPPEGARHKQEGDWRAPIGMFEIGQAFGDGPVAPQGSQWPYRTVTTHDLWVEDASATTYNQHIVVPQTRPLTAWEESQRMKMGDPAHALKIVIGHNLTKPAVPGAGSAIFMHIWRDSGNRPTSGCTAMARSDIEQVLKWLSVDAKPVFVMLDAALRAHARAAGDLP